MALIQYLFQKLGITISDGKFKAGDHVQRVEGSELMIVEWVKTDRKTRTSTLSCKWFDSRSKQTLTDLFKEDQVKPFDWYHPDEVDAKR
jgi:uncharacterized protein YodC (DUF2158 family)